MRVAMLSWEFPPKNVGGLARHVYDLTAALTRQGVEVVVFTCGAPGVPEVEEINGAKIHRVHPYANGTQDFITWVLQFNVALLERAFPVMQRMPEFTAVHAHDWLVAWAARALKHAYRLPLVATIHATEFGRNNGLHNDTQRFISSVEWWLAYEAWHVIVCSRYMENELKYVFQIPGDKLSVIQNGVEPQNFAPPAGQVSREWFAAPNEKIVFWVGRLVREKGVQVLLAAVPRILSQHPNTKFVIAGKGPYEQELRRYAEELGVADRVYFTGYIDDVTRNALYNWASVAVFPSLYEPFGLVALEAMAAGTPVVVTDTGGLGEIVKNGYDGLKCQPDNADAIAARVAYLLGNPGCAEGLKERAYRKILNECNWDDIAGETKAVYQKIRQNRRQVNWPDFGQTRRFPGKVYQLFGRYA
ncbi:MAG: glycosyltransferase family 1 protein [Ammonifex sp.]|jgi:glycosyltransferase involved in cell wall biosynthesis|nr:MAG: glycosyltransferase family 1 protein [Ammonifex sp.]